MLFCLIFFFISSTQSHIFVYNLCEYNVPIWQDEVIGFTEIEVIDEAGDKYIGDDVPVIGLKQVAEIGPDGSFSFEDELSVEDSSYRFGEGGRMEARFASVEDYLDYYEISISDGYEVPMRLQPDRTDAAVINCLNETCFGVRSMGEPITSKTESTEVGTNFAIFLCPL